MNNEWKRSSVLNIAKFRRRFDSKSEEILLVSNIRDSNHFRLTFRTKDILEFCNNIRYIIKDKKLGIGKDYK